MLSKILCAIGLHKEVPWCDVKENGKQIGAIHCCKKCGKMRYFSFTGDGISKWKDSFPEIQKKLHVLQIRRWRHEEF
ncbi:hypothetical protein B5F53_11850 [Blautia sp. An249]|uniref:hypothetical protein n=1 Tax=Blautia sp. An249 TaxID=1965603 RepID=UPI000B3A9355|nr:hypothetical protein [Blautia sp. An249]OUO77902.1 hypothetical protein B5F53_11850 [Blautia sp. An249]